MCRYRGIDSTPRTSDLSPPLPWRHLLLVAAGFVTGVVVLYSETLAFPFNRGFDDVLYVLDNPQVQGGISLRGLGWAVTTFDASNWHPLTWLSHMLDVELWGMEAAGHRLMNLLLHALAAVLLVVVLHRATGSWRGTPSTATSPSTRAPSSSTGGSAVNGRGSRS